MFEGRRVTVVVPAYNEEKLIRGVLDSMPRFVDRIIVVDDASSDGTPSILQEAQKALGNRLRVIRHPSNGGVGAAIISGYRAAVEESDDSGLVAGRDALGERNALGIFQAVREEAHHHELRRLGRMTGDAQVERLVDAPVHVIQVDVN